MKKGNKNNKTKRKFYFLPKTRLGKWSAGLVLIGLLIMYSQYWIAMAFKISMPIPIGFLSVALILMFGITSIISILKYRDYAISLFVTSLLGIFGIILLLGEFLIPH